MPRVMIVEDDLTILSNLSQILQLSGLDVIEAHDGDVAWTILQSRLATGAALPKLIVSDLMMPKMDGFELLAAVRDHAELESIPFVLLSARSDASDLHQAFTLGASEYLVKPFEVDQLMDVIRHFLSKTTQPPDEVPGYNNKANTDFFLE
ncbi:response regulator [Limnobacter parvus]|uniref:Response regulator n=1 Tax=Limnobacter parvus TaxID=2939690 RepID=A0ABT1XDV6_9BURK|nr:response regulator [Limnobacter parvus]MCR2745448.1 response regulator [Limnobacter parvus]